MKEQQTIVAHGGWIGPKISCRPKARLFRVLSILWIFITIGCVFILANGWSETSVPIQHWIAIALIVLHGVWIFLARHFAKTEQPIEVPTVVNPRVNPNNLY